VLIDPTDSWVRSAFVPVFPVYWSSTTRGILSWTDGYVAVIYSLRPTKNVHLRFKICPPTIFYSLCPTKSVHLRFKICPPKKCLSRFPIYNSLHLSLPPPIIIFCALNGYSFVGRMKYYLILQQC